MVEQPEKYRGPGASAPKNTRALRKRAFRWAVSAALLLACFVSFSGAVLEMECRGGGGAIWSHFRRRAINSYALTWEGHKWCVFILTSRLQYDLQMEPSKPMTFEYSTTGRPASLDLFECRPIASANWHDFGWQSLGLFQSDGSFLVRLYYFPAWVLYVIGALAFLAFARPWIVTLVYRRIRPGTCPKCGYDLRASSSRCPECGTPVTAAGGGTMTGSAVI